MFRLWIFVYDRVVRKFEGDCPNDLLAIAKPHISRYANHGPVTVFEFHPEPAEWKIVPTNYQDWSHSIVLPLVLHRSHL